MATKSKGRDRGHDSLQLTIDWASSPSKPTVLEPTGQSLADQTLPVKPPDPSVVAAATTSSLVQYLPWDFAASFPPPLPEAIEAGLLHEGDVEWANLKALHDVHGVEMCKLLEAHDRLLDARRRGVDPATGKPPQSSASAERCRVEWEKGPCRILDAYNVLLGTYADGFGVDAAEAFDKAVRARHAGVEVREGETRPAAEAVRPPRQSAPRERSHVERQARRKRVSTTMPVPKPLASAVAAGHFGTDEQGRPVRPCNFEVREITEAHADWLTEMLRASPPTVRGQAVPDPVPFTDGIAKYAEDFGSDAASRLERHVRHRVQLERDGRAR